MSHPGLTTVRRHLRFTALSAAGCALMLAGCSNPPVNPSSGSSDAATQDVAAVSVDEELSAMVPQEFVDAGVVQVATNAPFPPYQMFASPGSEELIGLEIDLGQAIGEKLGVEFSFSQQPYDGLIPGLQAGKYDVLMATLFDTAEREEAVDFVNYARSGSGILVKATTEDIAVLKDLCGRSAAAQNGSLQVTLLEGASKTCTDEGAEPIEIKTFPAFSDEQLALNSGNVEAIVGDLPALGYASTSDPSVKVVEPETPGGYESSYIGIGVPKEDPELTAAITEAVRALMEDGTYEAILEKYGVPQTAIDEPLGNQYGG
ncbi:ABC transporter substrate-binding protein [Arthrobacter sp. TmT3-37]